MTKIFELALDLHESYIAAVVLHSTAANEQRQGKMTEFPSFPHPVKKNEISFFQVISSEAGERQVQLNVGRD